MAVNIQKIASDLCLNVQQVKDLGDNDVAVVVLDEWLLNLFQNETIPRKGSVNIPSHDMMYPTSVFCGGKVEAPWRKLTVRVIYKPEDGAPLRVPRITTDMLLKPDLDFMEFMHCMSQQNYNSHWRQAYHKYGSWELMHDTQRLSPEGQLVDFKDVLQTLYQCPIIHAHVNQQSFSSPHHPAPSMSTHSNIVPVICAIECKTAFYLLQPHIEHTLHDCVTFSPAMLGQSYAKPLFVVYQLLQIMKHCHQTGIPCGDVTLGDFTVNAKLWISMKGPRWETLFKCAAKSICDTEQKGVKTQESKCIETKSIGDIEEDKKLEHWNLDALPELVMEWVTGKLSNYDYLMILNHLACRCKGNPNYHPVLPWVMDFTKPDGGYRDLAKSKYRLNKGDRQLDLTYEAALNMAVSSSFGRAMDTPVPIPHHISDVLSEITYFVYNARQTPKQILCSHVRANWVPGEYPSNMQRMQEWTPDECIPEFFSDPNIFVSIHEDLPDLAVPSWCSGPEDFIKKHRAVLESDHVSEKLHRWIDLTFGYKLSGSAAVKTKNVCLHLVDQHTQPTNQGVVQLFNVPHPKRVARSCYIGPTPPVIQLKRGAQTDDGIIENKVLESKTTDEPVLALEATSAIAAGLVATVDGTMGNDLSESTVTVTKGVEKYNTNGSMLVGGQDIHIEESTDSQTTVQSSVEIASQNGSTVTTSTDSSSATLSTGGSSGMEDSLPQTKTATKKFPFFRSRGETLDTKPSIPRPEHQTIVLPEDYDPLAALNHLESVCTFSSKALQGLPAHTKKEKPVDMSHECLSKDMQAVGCIIAELFLAPKLRMQNPKASLNDRYQTLQRMITTEQNDLPRPIKQIINMLLKLDNRGKSPMELHVEHSSLLYTPSILLQPFADIMPFPKYFTSLYQFLSELHSTNSEVGRMYTEGLRQRRQAMEKVQNATKWVPQILRTITSEGKEVLLPYIIELFSEPETALYASLLLLNKVMQYYGPEASVKSLLQPMLKTYDSDFTSPNAVLLFHRSFVSQLMIRFGQGVFMRHLLEFIVNATTGVKYCPRFDRAVDDPIGVMPETGRTRFMSEATEAYDFLKGGSFPNRTFIHNSNPENPEDVERRQTNSPQLKVTPVSSSSASDDDDDDMLIGEMDSKKDQSTSGDSSSLDALSLNEDTAPSSTFPEDIPTESSPMASTQSTQRPKDVQDTSLEPQVDTNPQDVFEEDVDTSADSSSYLHGAANSQELTDDDASASFQKAANSKHVDEGTSSPRFQRDASRQRSTSSPRPTPQAINNQSTQYIEESSTPSQRVHFAYGTPEPDHHQTLSSIDASVSSLLDLSPGSTVVNVAVDSVMWLVHRLGPALTASYLSSKLLKALAQCYVGKQQLANWDEDSDSESSDDEYGVNIERRTVQGDINAKNVLGCLTDIALLYGDQFIFQQYFPFIHETVKSVKKVNIKTESSLVACIVLLKHLLPYLTDKQLMDDLKMIFRKILQPLINIVSAGHLSFPSGGLARSVIAFKLVDILTTVALRIGREMTREHMTGILQQFFVCFELVHGENAAAGSLSPEYDRNTSCYSTDSEEMYCEIKVDSTSNQYKVGTPTKLEYLKGESGGDEMPRSPLGTMLSPKLSGDNLDQLGDGSWCDTSTMAELQQAFTPELAHIAYIPLCRLTGSIHMESKLYNHELIWKLSSTHEKELATQAATAAAWAQQQAEGQDDATLRQTSWFVDIGATVPATDSQYDDPLHASSGEFGKNVAIVGNRIDISGFGDSDSSDDEEQMGELLARQRLKGTSKIPAEKKENPSSQMGKGNRQLKGNWLAYWEQFTAKGELDHTYQFTQLKLQSFVGHTAGIRALCTMDNENSFVSASKDKMVKLWSLRNEGDGSHKSMCRYTYPYHRKTVFAATFLEAPRLVATCDGVVHVWDPFTGAVVRQYDLTRGSPSLLVKMPAPSPILIAGMADATVRFIDTRHHSVQHEFKVASGPLGLIRCVAVSPDGNTLGVGLSSGVLSMVDIRTGLLLGGWRAHEGEVLQMKSCSNNTFVTTSVDHSIAMWKEDGQKVCSFRGANEPVHCLHISNGQIVSATTSNRIGVHSSLDHNASYYSTRLRSDVFKGVINAMEVLPLNKLLLVGSDNGTITLLA